MKKAADQPTFDEDSPSQVSARTTQAPSAENQGPVSGQPSPNGSTAASSVTVNLDAGSSTAETAKLDVKQTFLLGFGFFAFSLGMVIYNSFVPKILESLVPNTAMIGLVLSVCTLIGIVFQPLFGHLSDRTRSRLGRRRPYLLAGVPACAIIFALIPQMHSLWSLIPLLILFWLGMSVWRAPTVSLMPDLTPQRFQGQANGIVNLMGGIASLLAFVAGGAIFNIGGYSLLFITVAVIMPLAVLVLMLTTHEEDSRPGQFIPQKMTGPKLKLDRSDITSLLLILVGVFFWFAGYYAVENFFTLYATHTLGIKTGYASMLLGAFSLSFLVFAVPAGYIGAKLGRRRTILLGLVGVIVVFFPLVLAENVFVTIASLLLGGFFWACININSLPMITKLSGTEKVGTYIGYYYIFEFAAEIITPTSFGLVRDWAGTYRSLFAYAIIAFVFALAALIFVRRGEADEPAAAAVVK